MVSNIERFDIIVVLALADLYSRFPVRQYLASSKFIVTEDGEHIDGLSPEEEWLMRDKNTRLDDPYFKRKKFASESLKWLVDAGYIHGTSLEYEGINDAVLTAKGLEVLKATPDSLQGSLGERLVEAVKADSREVGRTVLGQIFGLAVGLLS
ncbi:hypothetical protein [Aeromonas sp. FDAARGOS 1419]|uniref:hypothetical protein n=1 Tax=Aeromonas sp. FDAARGOS 1419 TaxID=2778068 RepID=UPI001C236A6C|nr:hypothetical protein [Aeromonas sp. FDAARGOS 1419]QWZ78767.1 hypothetical protein I6L49_07410 [Aeromonas sp. FDAARGOS 1419]